MESWITNVMLDETSLIGSGLGDDAVDESEGVDDENNGDDMYEAKGIAAMRAFGMVSRTARLSSLSEAELSFSAGSELRQVHSTENPSTSRGRDQREREASCTSATGDHLTRRGDRQDRGELVRESDHSRAVFPLSLTKAK